MYISLPPTLEEWVEKQVEKGAYADSASYIRELITQDRAHKVKLHALQAAITEGLQSGISNKSLEDVRQEARKRANKTEKGPGQIKGS